MSMIRPPKITKFGKGEDKFQMNYLDDAILGLLKCKIKLNNFKDYVRWDLTKRLVFERSASGGRFVDELHNCIHHIVYVGATLKSQVSPDKADLVKFPMHEEENMTLKPTSFGSRCKLTEKFQMGVLMSGIIDMFTALSQAKYNMVMLKRDFAKALVMGGLTEPSPSLGTYINQSELIQFSMADNIFSIPPMVDGSKPSQHKAMYVCLLQPYAEVKVATLTGIIKKLAYHHGDQSLASTNIALTQDFVGDNNFKLLSPIGQFGP
ncbi:DNA topoisomerase 2 [Massospora cicadina]|nr:DNA topoisomerase 2 [Massospora cicadina]